MRRNKPLRFPPRCPDPLNSLAEDRGSDLVLRCARLSVAHLDSGGYQRFVVDAPAFAARPSADSRLIDLDMLFRLTADTVLVRQHHDRAQFVQDAEGGFIACEPSCR